MKNYILLLMCLGSFAFAQAHIQISEEDLLSPTIITQIDDDGSTRFAMPGLGGAKVWDYLHFSPGDTTVASIKTASSSPHYSEFPDATLVEESNGENSSIFYKTGKNGLYFIGGYIDTVKFEYKRQVLVYPAPISYEQTIKDSSRSESAYPQYFFTGVLCTRDKFEAVGYGTVKTPAGTFSNTLLIKETHYRYDTSTYAIPGVSPTVYITLDTTVRYSWYQKDSELPVLLSFDIDSLGKVSNASYLIKGNVTSVVSGKVNENFFHQYPVPADKQLVIELQKGMEGTLTVYDINGQSKFRQSVNNPTDKVLLETGSLPEGMYFYEITSSSGVVVKNKIAVAH